MTALDDDNHTFSVVMDITQGMRYRWGNIQMIGLDPKTATILRARLPVSELLNTKYI